MAITRVSFTSDAVVGDNNDQIVISKPASVAEDDVLVAAILNTDQTPATSHANWTQRMILDDYGTNRSRLTVHTRVLTDSEPASWTFAGSDASSQGLSWVCAAYRGVDLTDLLAGTPVELAYDKPDNTTWQCPSMTTDADGAMVIRVYAAAEVMGAQVIAAPSPFAEVDYQQAPNNWAVLLVCDDVQDTAGATGTLNATSNISDFGDAFGAVLALKPAAGGGTTDKAVAGSVTASGALTRQVRKGVAGSSAASGAIVKQTSKAMGGSLTSAGAIVRQTSKTLAGSATAAGSVVKRTARTIAGSVTASGALAASRVFLQALAGSVTATGSVVRQTAKGLAGSVSAVGTITRHIAKTIAGSVTAFASLSFGEQEEGEPLQVNGVLAEGELIGEEFLASHRVRSRDVVATGTLGRR